ncbi:MAG TPA: proline--tRNA ligase [Lachnospiraceae bacterium]|nr:proline--tRNA ligase [Lachnospiraceae bacterium]
MKLEKMVGDRFKEKPTDCVIDSHALMMRGGYMKDIAKGIYSQYPPLKRICRKIEEIIREEMDGIGGQEVLFPVVMSSNIWEESGRYESIGQEMLRFTDRNGARMLLGMTHEEAAVHLVRDYANSYQNYPFMIYQIQTKFRDEARPRAGLIRVREFTMKDAYSFHTSQEDLEEYYKVVYDAYNRIFARAGVPEVITVASDSGMMGGSVAHEYMLLTPVGEDSLAICEDEACDYSANMEAAKSIIINEKNGSDEELKEVYTPDIHTIEDICEFLKTPLTQSCKAVVYQKNADDEYVVIFIRGDLDVNETKLTNYLGEAVHPAEITPECGLNAGYIGPVNLHVNGKPTVIYDESLKGTNNLSCGANKDEYHYTGLCMERDVPDAEYVDVAKIIDGGICPKCGKKTIKIHRGIEVGNIFQLGTKYTKSMNMTYLDADGKTQTPIMGCYGIGVGRLAASVCEAHHDEYGPIWPITIAPWQVHLCALRVDDQATREFADKLYDDMQNEGIEVIYDDRKARPGVMFSDADLLGVPIRLVVSPRNMEEGVVELVTRDKSISEKVATADILGRVRSLIDELTKAINSKA